MPYRYPIKFGKYLLTRRIAVGGMAEVFKAKLLGIKGFEKILAVKRILPEFNDDEEFLQMFVDEARISSSLHHSNVVQVFDFGQVLGSYYIAMELVDGPNLKNFAKRLIRHGRPIPRNISIYILSQIARGLDYAHSVQIEGEAVLNLVHRDVSPQNVILSRSGEVKITDFGIAKAAIKLSRTQPGKIQGKFSYMSPEQAAGKSLDRRSDIFSLGIIAYELLTGAKLYAAEDTQKRYKEVREGRIPRLGTVLPDLPGQLESLVMRMLSKDPDDRPRTCAEIAAELGDILSNISKEELSTELGALVDEIYPREKSDSGIRRRVEEFADGPEPPTEIDVDRGEGDDEISHVTQPITSDLTDETIKITGWGKLTRLLGIAVVLALVVFLFVREKPIGKNGETEPPIQTADSLEPPDDVPLDEQLQATGPLDPDRAAEAQAREAEVEARMQELEEQLLDAEKRSYESEQRLVETRRKLEEVESAEPPPPPPPPPPCPKRMVLIPSGDFMYGSNENDPDRNALVEPAATTLRTQKFCIDRYEFPNEKGKPLKQNISWASAQAACTKQGKRLCAQEEWERGCKGPTKKGSNRRYPYGNEWDETICNTAPQDSSEETRTVSPAGTFGRCKTKEGVYDMSGNVDEWTASQGRFNPKSRVTRGGSVNRPGWASRCSSVRELASTAEEADVGFRCCKDAL